MYSNLKTVYQIYIPNSADKYQIFNRRHKLMNCWLCGADVDVEIIYESQFVGQVEGYECKHCGHIGETEN